MRGRRRAGGGTGGLTMLTRYAALWQTMLYNRDWLRYFGARLTDPGDDRDLSFRLRNGQTATVRGSMRAALNEIYLHRVYDIPGLDYRGCRQLFDFGANAGLFALYVAARAPAARIACFEPAVANFATLQRNLADNGVQAQAFRMAVSTVCELRRLSLAGGSGQYRLDGTADDFEYVTCVDLARVFELTGAATCDFLKMDIEGEELALLLRTPLADLRRIRAMAMEWHHPDAQLAEVRERLSAAGFDSWVEHVGHDRHQVMLKARQP